MAVLIPRVRRECAVFATRVRCLSRDSSVVRGVIAAVVMAVVCMVIAYS